MASRIENCYFYTREQDDVLFNFHLDGRAEVTLQDMAIIPMEEFYRLKTLAGEDTRALPTSGPDKKGETTDYQRYKRAMSMLD